MSDRYQRLKEQRRCTRCGEQDERTLAGRTVCAKCSAIKNARNVAYRAKHTAQTRLRDKSLYWGRVQAHLCTRCGAPLPAWDKRRRCFECSVHDSHLLQEERNRRAEALKAEKAG